MALLADHEIRERALKDKMIEPFIDGSVRGEGIISYGLSPYGYDARMAPDFRVFTNVDSPVIDPKKFDDRSFVKRDGDVCIIPPNSFVLTKTVEYFRVPRDVLALCIGKSTYARCGLIVNVTPLNPEWEGHVTLEISNTTPLPARIYANEGICQFLFFRSAELPTKSYAELLGKYQGITEVEAAHGPSGRILRIMELLKIKATDAEDMEVMSLCLQDAALQVADITWRPGGSGRTGRFGFNVQRLCHEKKKQGLMRVNCRFWVDGVVEAKHRTDVQDMLSLVLLAIVPQEDGLILHFNDNKVIKLIAPKWHAYLEDFGVHWPADKASPHAE